MSTRKQIEEIFATASDLSSSRASPAVGYGSSMVGSNAGDMMVGTSGNDAIYGNRGNDKLTGGEGNDLLDGGIGRDTLIGGAGNDVLKGGAGKDVLVGGDGNNQLDGGGGSDTAVWNNEWGVQIVFTSAKGDGVAAANPDDWRQPISYDNFTSIENFEAIKGSNSSLDWSAALSAAQRVNVDLASEKYVVSSSEGGILSQGKVKGFTDVVGGRGADTILGNEEDNRIDGGSGDDILNGRAGTDHLNGGYGDDTLIFGDGNDHLYGGEGRDLIVFEDAHANGSPGRDPVPQEEKPTPQHEPGGDGGSSSGLTRVVVDLDKGYADVIWQKNSQTFKETNGLVGIEDVRGGAGDDYLIGKDGVSNHLIGGAGDDVIKGVRGLFEGTSSDDSIDPSDVEDHGYVHDSDVLEGGAGNDLIIAESSDKVDGGEGFDTLILKDILAGRNPGYDWDPTKDPDGTHTPDESPFGVSYNKDTGDIYVTHTGQVLMTVKNIEHIVLDDGHVLL